jgi:mannose-6-phosphate isomerase-like protein (cupin superfamily)
MQVRRVVTGSTEDGKATVVNDSNVDGITVALAPGFEWHRLWGADRQVDLPSDGSPPSFHTYFPPVDGFRFGLFTVPPNSDRALGDIDFEKAAAEMEEKLPGMAGHLEPENPGMHTTDTIDFEYVISGEVWLELDNGEEVLLKAGDSLIQNGTRHSWHNRGTEPCRMVACLVGAKRQ